MLGGETLLDRALGIARGWSDDVLRSRDGRRRDAPGIEGPLRRRRRPRSRLGGDVLTIPCDMPFLPADLPERLGRRRTTSRGAGESGGRLHPVCALWRAARSRAAAYTASGRRSLHGFAEAVGYRGRRLGGGADRSLLQHQ